MKKLFLLAILFFAFIFISPSAFAQNNFSTAYSVNYAVNNNSLTHVTINSVLTNLTDKYYASSYSIQIGFKDIRNLRGTDDGGDLQPKVIKTSSGSQILITFNKQVVGLNNTLNFNLNFDTSEVAQNYNNIWDINIPGISNDNDFSSFNVTVNYPSFLGIPTFIKPAVANFNPTLGKLTFSKDDLGNSGISLAFGNYQVYNFSLDYNLENQNLFPIFTEIALPPDTNYQKIDLENLTPKPVNVRIDNDGNWLARYNLTPSQKLTVTAKGKAKVYLNPKNEELTSDLKSLYLKKDNYWEVDNPKIVDLAKRLKTPYEIYKYVVNTLNYDFSRVESNSPRLGAVAALQNTNSAVCLEFTDLFIAIARAAGIPAREVDGFAYTNNSSERPLSFVKDILHAWPQYYDFDKKEWIMVDPTWGKTTGGIDYFNTLDFDHIAFVVKGVNSNYPIPAGGYKFDNATNKKDVNVEIGNNFNDINPEVDAEINFPNELIAGLPITSAIKIFNNSSQIKDGFKFSVQSNYLSPNNQSKITTKIPPFGFIEIPISYNRTFFLTNSTDTIKIGFGNKYFYKNILIKPFYLNRLFILGGLIFVSFTITISSITYLLWRVYLYWKKRRDSLRWKSNQP